MGNKLFGVDIAAIVASAAGPGLLDVTLWIRPKSGTRDPSNLSAGLDRAPAKVVGAKGIWEDYRPSEIGDLVRTNDRRAFILGDTIPAGIEIKESDEIEIDGQRLYVIRPESVDPAKAGYRFHCGDRTIESGE